MSDRYNNIRDQLLKGRLRSVSKAFDLSLADKVKSNCEEASVRKEVGKRETCSVEIGGEIEKKVESCGVKSSEEMGT